MSKLNDTQLLLLSGAAQRDDRVVVLPTDLKEKSAGKALRLLLKNRLIEEVPATKGYPGFRRNVDGDPIALRLTDAGLAAIGVEPESGEPAGLTLEASGEPPASSDAEFSTVSSKKKLKKPPELIQKPGRATGSAKVSVNGKAKKNSRDGSNASGTKRGAASPQPGSKQARLISLLHKKQGATIDVIVKANGWLPHTARAVISGLRKQGYRIEFERKEGGKGTYRIVAASKRSAARK